MDTASIAETVRRYVAAWNGTDATARDKLLVQCWAEAGAYVDPSVQFAGRQTLAAHIAKMQADRPGSRIEFMSGIDIHHNVARFLWRLVRADGSAGDTSIDFAEVGADGQLTKIVGFFGAAPQLRG